MCPLSEDQSSSETVSCRSIMQGIESSRNKRIAIIAIGRTSKKLKRWVVINSGETKGHGEDLKLKVCYKNEWGWAKLEQIVSLTPENRTNPQTKQETTTISDATSIGSNSSGCSTPSLCEEDDSSSSTSSSSSCGRDSLSKGSYDMPPALHTHLSSNSSTSSDSDRFLSLNEPNISNINSSQTLNDSASILGSTLSFPDVGADDASNSSADHVNQSSMHTFKASTPTDMTSQPEQVRICEGYEQGATLEIIALGKSSKQLKRWTVVSTGFTGDIDGVNVLSVAYRNIVHGWVPFEWIVDEGATKCSPLPHPVSDSEPDRSSTLDADWPPAGSVALSSALGEDKDGLQLESFFSDRGTHMKIVVEGESGQLEWHTGTSSGMTRFGEDGGDELWVHCEDNIARWVDYRCVIPTWSDHEMDDNDSAVFSGKK